MDQNIGDIPVSESKNRRITLVGGWLPGKSFFGYFKVSLAIHAGFGAFIAFHSALFGLLENDPLNYLLVGLFSATGGTAMFLCYLLKWIFLHQGSYYHYVTRSMDVTVNPEILNGCAVLAGIQVLLVCLIFAWYCRRDNRIRKRYGRNLFILLLANVLLILAIGINFIIEFSLF